MERHKQTVAAGYDAMADAYLERFGKSTVRAAWLDQLVSLVPAGGRVLDIGCGAGVPVACRLVDAGFIVDGVDSSGRQIGLARRNVASATFHHADVMEVAFPPCTFDAVAAFYSITHVPRSEHSDLFRRVAGWLKPGGVFVASLSVGESADWSGTWLGVEMFFSHFDAATNLRLVAEAGLTLERSEVVPQDNEDAEFLWVVARKPVMG